MFDIFLHLISTHFLFSVWIIKFLKTITCLISGSDPKFWDSLSKPLCPHIYFVGEHTSFDGHGSLHGAYNTGVRAANLILSDHCEKKKVEEEKQRRRKAIKKKKDQAKKQADSKNNVGSTKSSIKNDSLKKDSSDKKDELWKKEECFITQDFVWHYL